MTRSIAGLAIVAILAGGAPGRMASTRDPFAFLEPDVVIDPVERSRLDGGQPLVRVLPARDGHLALSAAVRVDVSTDRFIAWATQVEKLQKGRYVRQMARFSAPPRVKDLEGLTFEAEDLEDLRRCRPGDCGVKLNDAEIARLPPRLVGPKWAGEAQRGLREVHSAAGDRLPGDGRCGCAAVS